MASIANVAFTLGYLLNRSCDENEGNTTSTKTLDEFDELCTNTFIKDLSEFIESLTLTQKQANRLYYMLFASPELSITRDPDNYVKIMDYLLEEYNITHKNHLCYILGVMYFLGRGPLAAAQMSKFDASTLTQQEIITIQKANRYSETESIEVCPEYTREYNRLVSVSK